jgi:hypothetical protein
MEPVYEFLFHVIQFCAMETSNTQFARLPKCKLHPLPRVGTKEVSALPHSLPPLPLPRVDADPSLRKPFPSNLTGRNTPAASVPPSLRLHRLRIPRNRSQIRCLHGCLTATKVYMSTITAIPFWSIASDSALAWNR